MTDVLFPHIACCVDQSDQSRRAAGEARRLAAGGGRLSLVHVAEPAVQYVGPEAAVLPDPGWTGEYARQWLEPLAAEFGGEPVLLIGHPASTVCDWAAQAHPDLLVAAAHRGLVDRLLFGSFASHLAHYSPVDVLLVRPRGRAPGGDA